MGNESTYRLKAKEFNDREDDADCMKDLSSISSTDKLVDYEEWEDNIPWWAENITGNTAHPCCPHISIDNNY